MSEARLVAVAGSVAAALLATWLGYWISVFAVGGPGHFDDAWAVWKLWGCPAGVAAGAAAYLVTRTPDWLPTRWRFTSLGLCALRCVGWACLLYLPVQIGCLVVLSLAGGIYGGTGGFGIAGAGILLAYMDAIAVAFGVIPAVLAQMLVLLLARAVVVHAENELKSIEEWKRTH